MTKKDAHYTYQELHYGDYPHQSQHNKAPKRPGRLKRFMAALALTSVIGGGVAATAEAAHLVNKQDRAKYEADQKAIAPIIEKTMVGIDNQTLEQYRQHPDTMHRTDNPEGHEGVVEFTNGVNVWVYMGETDGQPNPNDPVFVQYKNNVGTGEGTNGMEFVLTAPSGNWQVDDLNRPFGGTTYGGWGAVIPGSYDTTDRGYANNGPDAATSAQDIADTVDKLGPYDPYSVIQ